MSHRRVPLAPLLALPAVAAAGAATLWGEAMYAVHRGLPSVIGHDPSGVIGDPSYPEVTMLLLGDSTMTGSGLESPDDIWIRQLATRLADRFRIRLVSVAEGGALMADVLERQLPPALGQPADLAILSAGANDVLRVTSLRRVERDMMQIVRELGSVAPTVLLSGVGDLGNVPRVPYPLSALATARSRAVDRIHIRVANDFAYADKIPVGALVAQLRRDRSLYSPDWFHPNRAGHEIWADAATPPVAAALERVVRDRRAHA